MQLQICVWINPYIAQESALFDEAADNGYFIKKGDGSVWQYDYWVSKRSARQVSSIEMAHSNQEWHGLTLQTPLHVNGTNQNSKIF